MVEAPCIPSAPRHFFRMPRHGRRKVHVVRLGGGGARAHDKARGGRGLRLRRWLSRAVWRLAELCVAALSSPGGGHPAVPASSSPPPWSGIEPCFAAPFVPVATIVKRARPQD